MASQSAMSARRVPEVERGRLSKAAAAPVCPACKETSREAAIERYGSHELFGCGACGLQFWEPRRMPDACWYEQMYGGRDENLLPLEPGHKYFLADPLAARGGELLDIGCGTGNFLAAAQGKILGWFQGRMEFGPRALGSRSILADPRDPEMNAKSQQCGEIPGVVAAVCAFHQEGSGGRIPGERNGFAIHDSDGAGASGKTRRNSGRHARGRKRAAANRRERDQSTLLAADR